MSGDYAFPQKRNKRKVKKKDNKRHPYKKGGRGRVRLKKVRE